MSYDTQRVGGVPLLSYDDKSNRNPPKTASTFGVGRTDTPPIITETELGYESNYDYAQQRVRLQFRQRFPLWNPYWQVGGLLGFAFDFFLIGFGIYGYFAFGVESVNLLVAVIALIGVGLVLLPFHYFFFFSRFWRLLYVRLYHFFWWVEKDIATKMNMPMSLRQRFIEWKYLKHLRRKEWRINKQQRFKEWKRNKIQSIKQKLLSPFRRIQTRWRNSA